MRGVPIAVTAIACAACTLTTSLDGYVGAGPLQRAPDASADAAAGTDAHVDATALLAITSLALVNADTAQVVPGYEALATGAQIPRSLAKWNIRAEVPGDPGSVQFDVDRRPAHTENNPPFYMCGDDGHGGVNSCDLPSGERVLRITPFENDARGGAGGAATTITIVVP